GASATGTTTTRSCATGASTSTARCWAPKPRAAGTEEASIMSLPPLEPIAGLAGHPLSAADLEQVALILDGRMKAIPKLRDLQLPDAGEPILAFRVEPWV